MEDKALEITGNLEEENSSQMITKARKWKPYGTISVWDSSLGKYVGVEGVEVRAKRWFTTHKGYTSSSGKFVCDGRFKRDVNYSLKWERYNFEIRRSGSGTAMWYGPKKRGEWNEPIKDNIFNLFNATIFRAAHHYYYKDIKGLRRPPLNSTWKTQLKIRAYYEVNDDINGTHQAWRRFLGLGSAVRIYNPQRASQNTYGTVIHELAHASHWAMSSSTFNDTESIVKESWARGVEWELTKMVYPNYQTSFARLNYTRVVVDMVDGCEIRGTSAWWDYSTGSWGTPYTYKSYYDRVSGYTIKQIEDALKGQKNWNGWKANIKNKYNNETEKYLDATFSYWNTK